MLQEAVFQKAGDDAERHIRDILTIAVEHGPPQRALVVYDTRCDLAQVISAAYRHCLPDAAFLDFDAVTPDFILSAFKSLSPSDLVVLIQTTNFRLEAFRIRVELFKHAIKVIEHPHLERMTGDEALRYIDSLAYDPAYYRGVGQKLKQQIDDAPSAVLDSGGEFLVFSSGLEPAKLNVGDYTGMKNVGGQFPIGEVFTEARDLESVNGRVRIFAFADVSFQVNKPDKAITLVIEKGRIVAALDSPPEFDQVLANIRADETEVWVREFGFGLNRAFSEDRRVSDIGTYERMCGVHLSLGAKHAVYNKPAFRRRTTRHHVDVFAATKSVTLGNSVVFQDGAWKV